MVSRNLDSRYHTEKVSEELDLKTINNNNRIMFCYCYKDDSINSIVVLTMRKKSQIKSIISVLV